MANLAAHHRPRRVNLNKLAKTRSGDRVLQMRAYVRDIFAEAVEQDFLVKDSCTQSHGSLAVARHGQNHVNVGTATECAFATVVAGSYSAGTRHDECPASSELFALRWKCFDQAESKMQVSETAYKGTIPLWGKTKKSLRRVHLPKELAGDLLLWKQECPDSSPEAFIFSDAEGRFMDTGNYHRRVLHKLEKDLELPKLTFQVIRRTIATLAQKKGTVKDVQGLLRHSRAATTTDVYMQEIPESVQATVNAINAELRVNREETDAG
jgi:hypothetical protein